MAEAAPTQPIAMTTKQLAEETGIPNSVIKKAMKNEKMECRSDRKGSYTFWTKDKEKIVGLCFRTPAERKADARAEKAKKYERLIAKVEAEADLTEREKLLAKARKQSVITEEKLEEMLGKYCGTTNGGGAKGKKASKPVEATASA